MLEVRPAGIFHASNPSSIAVITTGSRLLHISGQVSRDPEGRTVAPGDILGQARQVIRNLRTIVEDQGASLADICRLTVYVTAAEYFRSVMQARAENFVAPYPSATGLVVVALGHPDWLVEIEATAALPG